MTTPTLPPETAIADSLKMAASLSRPKPSSLTH